MNSHVPTFSGIDPSYALPDNVAVITLQVRGGCLVSSDISTPYYKLVCIYFEHCRNLKMGKYSFGWLTYTRS